MTTEDERESETGQSTPKPPEPEPAGEPSPPSEPPEPAPDESAIDEVDVRDMLRRAMRVPAPEKPPSAVLGAVQRKIREESEGRYFADGWGTHAAPRATFLVTSLLMLALVALAWLWLGPHDIRPLP